MKFIDDSMLAKVKNAQIEELEAQGMNAAQIEQTIEITGKLMTPEMIPIFGLAVGLFAGFIFSLVVSIFTNKANPTKEFN